MCYLFDQKDFYSWNWRKIWLRKVNYKFIFRFLLADVIKNMKTYCPMCWKKIENLNSKTFKTKKGRLILQPKSIESRIKKSRFVKLQEAKGLLSNLGIKVPLSKTSLLNVLF